MYFLSLVTLCPASSKTKTSAGLPTAAGMSYLGAGTGAGAGVTGAFFSGAGSFFSEAVSFFAEAEVSCFTLSFFAEAFTSVFTGAACFAEFSFAEFLFYFLLPNLFYFPLNSCLCLCLSFVLCEIGRICV